MYIPLGERDVSPSEQVYRLTCLGLGALGSLGAKISQKSCAWRADGRCLVGAVVVMNHARIWGGCCCRAHVLACCMGSWPCPAPFNALPCDESIDCLHELTALSTSLGTGRGPEGRP